MWTTSIESAVRDIICVDSFGAARACGRNVGIEQHLQQRSLWISHAIVDTKISIGKLMGSLLCAEF